MTVKNSVKRRSDLKPGTVFRYVSSYPARNIFYVPPKHGLMPKLVRGEIPKPSNNPKTDDYTQVLWDPEKEGKKWGEPEEL